MTAIGRGDLDVPGSRHPNGDCPRRSRRNAAACAEADRYGQNLSGTTIQADLGLPSTWFSVVRTSTGGSSSDAAVSQGQIAAFVVTHYAYANWRHAAASWASAAARNPGGVANIIARSANTHVSASNVAAFAAAHYAPANRARATRAILSPSAARQVQILARSVFPARIGPWRSRPARARAGYMAKKIGGLWWEVRV